MRTLTQWQVNTSTIFTAIILISISNVLSALFNTLDTYAGYLSWIIDLKSIGQNIEYFSAFVSGIGIVAYVIFYFALKNLGKTLADYDRDAINDLCKGNIAFFIGYCLDFVSMPYVPGIIWIVATVLTLKGYSHLKKSATLPYSVTRGAALLKTATVLTLIGVILSFIPIAGGIIDAILNFIAFFMVINGWYQIKTSPSPEGSSIICSNYTSLTSSPLSIAILVSCILPIIELLYALSVNRIFTPFIFGNIYEVETIQLIAVTIPNVIYYLSVAVTSGVLFYMAIHYINYKKYLITLAVANIIAPLSFLIIGIIMKVNVMYNYFDIFNCLLLIAAAAWLKDRAKNRKSLQYYPKLIILGKAGYGICNIIIITMITTDSNNFINTIYGTSTAICVIYIIYLFGVFNMFKNGIEEDKAKTEYNNIELKNEVEFNQQEAI